MKVELKTFGELVEALRDGVKVYVAAHFYDGYAEIELKLTPGRKTGMLLPQRVGKNAVRYNAQDFEDVINSERMPHKFFAVI